MSADATPIVPHHAGEFYAWLWWASEKNEGVFELPGDVGRVDLWVDERMAFRNPAESKISAIMTGDNPSNTLEARAALAGGKVLHEVRIGFRRDDREYFVTLKGPAMDVSGAKLPSGDNDGEDAVIYDRMFLYEELCLVLGALYGEFTRLRCDRAWDDEILPALRTWALGGEEEPG